MLLGVSQQAVHRACRIGRLRFEVINGRRALQRDGLERRWHGSSQRRVMVPVAQEPAPDWPRIAAQLNAYLGDSWPAPPWSGDQVNTLAMCLSLAEEGEEAEVNTNA